VRSVVEPKPCAWWLNRSRGRLPIGYSRGVTPEELLAHLDEDTLDPAAFHHEQHVATAWAALAEAGAEERICRGLKRLAERAQRAERYDEQLTLGFLRLIDERRRRAPAAGWPEFRARFPELFDRKSAQRAMRELDLPTDEAERGPRRRHRR
jgi:hypothetical protein